MKKSMKIASALLGTTLVLTGFGSGIVDAKGSSGGGGGRASSSSFSSSAGISIRRCIL